MSSRSMAAMVMCWPSKPMAPLPHGVTSPAARRLFPQGSPASSPSVPASATAWHSSIPAKSLAGVTTPRARSPFLQPPSISSVLPPVAIARWPSKPMVRCSSGVMQPTRHLNLPSPTPSPSHQTTKTASSACAMVEWPSPETSTSTSMFLVLRHAPPHHSHAQRRPPQHTVCWGGRRTITLFYFPFHAYIAAISMFTNSHLLQSFVFLLTIIYIVHYYFNILY